MFLRVIPKIGPDIAVVTMPAASGFILSGTIGTSSSTHRAISNVQVTMIVTITEMSIAATAGMSIVAMTIAGMTTVVMIEAMTEATTASTIMVSTTTASRMGTGTAMAKITKHLRYGLLAAVVGLHALPLWAEEVGNVAKQNTVSAPQAELAWMSGGIGDEARDEMRKAAAAYSVHMVFSDREGSYLSLIHI